MTDEEIIDMTSDLAKNRAEATRDKPCPTCHGYRAVPTGWDFRWQVQTYGECPTCHGSGVQLKGGGHDE